MINKMTDYFTILNNCDDIFQIAVVFKLEDIYNHSKLSDSEREKFYNEVQGGHFKDEDGNEYQWHHAMFLYHTFKSFESKGVNEDMKYWEYYFKYLKDNKALDELYSEIEEVYELITGEKLKSYCEG